MKLEMERAGLGRPSPAVTQPLQSGLGSPKRIEQSGVGNPLSHSGSSSLGGSEKGLFEGRNTLNITAPPIIGHMSMVLKSSHGRIMLEGLRADLTRQKNQWVLWRRDLTGGSLFPFPQSTQEGNGVAAETTRFQGPRWAHLLRGGGHLVPGGIGAVRAYVRA